MRAFLEFYVGVFTLVATTTAVAVGVAATQRLVSVQMRILFQGVHRAMAVMAVGFLVAHIVLKVMEAHASVFDAFLPFTGHGRHAVLVGLGTIAGDMLVVIVGTGVARGRFVTHPRPWLWRTVHGMAYVMWPVAIFHGLLAGQGVGRLQLRRVLRRRHARGRHPAAAAGAGPAHAARAPDRAADTGPVRGAAAS